jgi:hypothetical protein
VTFRVLRPVTSRIQLGDQSKRFGYILPTEPTTFPKPPICSIVSPYRIAARSSHPRQALRGNGPQTERQITGKDPATVGIMAG